MTPTTPVKIGFGCIWNLSRKQTWSHTPLSLLSALERTGQVADLGFDSAMIRQILRLGHLHFRGGRLHSDWRYQVSTMSLATKWIQREARATDTDVMVTIGDIGIFEQPFLIYQDLSFDLVLREVQAGNDVVKRNFGMLSPDTLKRLADRQRRIFDRTARVIAMSEWYGQSLVKDSGLDPQKVLVVRPGATATLDLPPIEPERRERSILFVGRDFARKGGELLLEAVRRLRNSGDDLSLTIVGPLDRPKALSPDTWIDFRGELDPIDVAQLMRSHTVFVLPTQFEPYGIVFNEALRAGTPCVGPNAFAIPEIITDGVDGVLFSEWTVEGVATAIARAIETDIRENAFVGAQLQQEQLSWERAAREVRAAALSVMLDQG